MTFRVTSGLAIATLAFAMACGPTTEEPADAGVPDAGEAPAEDAGPPPDTWENYAQGFFNSYCVGCHSDGARDYTTMAHVTRDEAGIRCGVAPTEVDGCGMGLPAPQQLPIGGGPFPDDDARTRLIEWIEGGLLTDADVE